MLEHRLQKVAHRAIPRGLDESKFQRSQSPLLRQCAKRGQHLVLDSPPQRPATEQKTVNLERIRFVALQHEKSHLSIIAKAIDHFHGPSFKSLRTPKCGEFCFRSSNR